MIENPLDEQSPAMNSQSGVTVGHEDLRFGEDVRYLHHTPGGGSPSFKSRQSPTSWPSTASAGVVATMLYTGRHWP